MFDPKGAILIEGGNPILRFDVFGTRLVCNFFDERNDRLFRWPVVPRCKRWCLSVCVETQRQKHDDDESAGQPRYLPTRVHCAPYLNDSRLTLVKSTPRFYCALVQ